MLATIEVFGAVQTVEVGETYTDWHSGAELVKVRYANYEERPGGPKKDDAWFGVSPDRIKTS